MQKKKALVLCGGGILGGIFEIGWLAAWEEKYGEGSIFNTFDIFIGISAGATVAALMAAGIPPGKLSRSIEQDDGFMDIAQHDVFHFHPSMLTKWAGNVWRAGKSLLHLRKHARHAHGGSELLFHLREMLPSGFYELSDYEHYLYKFFKKAEIPCSFSELPKKLFIPATDIDLGERVIFGSGYRDAIPIPKAIAASSAIPIFFEPVEIGGHYYVDGMVGKVGHVDIAIEQGASEILLINPLVPIRNDGENVCIPHLHKRCASLADRSFISVYEQSARIETQTRLELGLARYASENPGVQIQCAEPLPDCAALFLNNPMNFAARKDILHAGYEAVANIVQFGSA